MTNEHDEKVFNYLISRVSNRESASIAVISLASSASLIFLGLTSENFHWEFFVIGVSFPALAFAYNELTNRYLHQDDQNAINDLIEKTNPWEWENKTKKIIINENQRFLRRILMRYAFLSPILGWFLVLPIHFQWDMILTIVFDFDCAVWIFVISALTAPPKTTVR